MKNTFLILSLLLFLAVIFSTGCNGSDNSANNNAFNTDGYVQVLTYIENNKHFEYNTEDTLKKLGIRDGDIKLAKWYLEEYPKLPINKQVTVITQAKGTMQVDVTFPKIALSKNISWLELQKKYDEMNKAYDSACSKTMGNIAESMTPIETLDDLLKAFCAEGLSARIINSDHYKKLTDYEKLCMTVINKSGQLPEELKDTKALISHAEKISQAQIVAVVNKRPTFEQFKAQVDNDYRKVWNNNLSTVDGAVRIILEPYSELQYVIIEQQGGFNLKYYKFTGVQDIKNKAYLINQLKEKDLL